MLDITPIGKTDWRNSNQVFGIRDADRLFHIYCIGKTGVGKSTLIQSMAIADIQNGKGICLIDPHGDIAESILDYIPKERVSDVVYFNARDTEHPIAFNPLHNISEAQRHIAVAGLIATFRKIWSASWGPRMEYILRFCVATLFYYPGATLLHIQPLLTNADFRSEVLSSVTDESIRTFWFAEFDKYPPMLKAEAISPILNKTGLFIALKPIQSILGQPESSIDIADIMNTGKILICDLSKGSIGEDASTLLGSMLVNAIQLAAIGRTNQSEENRMPFYLYVDEMHNFITLSFADILAEARKYKLSLFLAHQYIEQLDEKIRSAIFGNVGTLIAFRVGAEDALYLAKEFAPVFSAEDLIVLPRFSIYLKLAIDGMTSRPFSAITLPLPDKEVSYKEQIMRHSKDIFGRNPITPQQLFRTQQDKDMPSTLFN